LRIGCAVSANRNPLSHFLACCPELIGLQTGAHNGIHVRVHAISIAQSRISVFIGTSISPPQGKETRSLQVQSKLVSKGNAWKGKPEGVGTASTLSESGRLASVYECSVCHVLFGRHAPQCPVCHHGALSLVGSFLPEKGQEQSP